MSTLNVQAKSPIVCVTAVTVSAQSTKLLKYTDIQFGSQLFELVTNIDGSFRGQFPTPIELTSVRQVILQYLEPEELQSTHVEKKNRKIDTNRLLASATNDRPQELSITQDDIRVTFSCLALAESSLHPTTQSILDDCPRFRILVIGKAGVGKSSLINITFGINEAHTSDLQRDEVRIEQELTSPVNPRFVLHDSLGFEPGEKAKYEIVKKFIQRKQSGLLKDQLHAIWFCIEAPLAGGRLLERSVEDFFRSKHDMLGTIPIVVVFTKFDEVVNAEAIKLRKSNQGRGGQEVIRKQARSQAESIVQIRHNEIAQLAGENIPWAIVSTKKHYENTLSNLVQLTYRLVGANDVPDADITSVVTMMAQRVDPHLKLQGSIAVGKRRYWKALTTSPDFMGRTTWDCLSVIYSDIVAVWNFYDPGCHLMSNRSKELVINVVQDMQVRTVPKRAFIGTLVPAISGALGTIANRATPIVVPIVIGLAAVMWIYDVYQNAKTVQQRFIAFIVDLTHIMETLLILTGSEHKRLTRRIIKLACRTYSESDVMAQAHTKIQAYRDLDGRDAALDMIESLINPERSGNSDMKRYCAEVRKLDLSKLDLN